MVRRGQSYRTQAQRDHRNRSRGGFTRQERMSKKVREENAYLREQGLTRVRFSTAPISAHTDDAMRGDANDYAVYGVYNDGSEWVLTGLSATSYYVKASDGSSKDKDKYVGVGTHGDVRPQDGVPIKRFDTKKAALRYVSADGSERVESGVYLVRPEHDPRTRREKVDKDAFYEFTRNNARKVWE